MDRAGLACSLGDAESEGVVRRHCKLNMLILLVAAAAAGRRWAAEACRVAIIREPQQLMVQLCQVQQRELAEEIVVIRHYGSRLGLDHHRGEQEQRLEVAVCEPVLFRRTMMNLKQWRAHMQEEHRYRLHCDSDADNRARPRDGPYLETTLHRPTHDCGGGTVVFRPVALRWHRAVLQR